MGPLEITGNVRDRFIQAAVLLYMLDPLRGEPTGYGLDQDPYEVESPRERMLKRKFLDSFALVCAIRKDGDSVSAACIEEGLPEGTIIRVASNSGVREETLSQVREIVGILNHIASGGTLSPIGCFRLPISLKLRSPFIGPGISDKETDILLRIIRLDIEKIRRYLRELLDARKVYEGGISAVELHVLESPATSNVDAQALRGFLRWFAQFFEIMDLPPNPEPEALIHHIKWAQEAKRSHLEFLKVAFSTQTYQLPRWVYAIFKLGRYSIASKAFVRLASEFPALFNPMIVEPVTSPPITRFTPKDAKPLTSALRRAAGGSEKEYISRLASIWDTADPEAHFRRVCSKNLVVHAEMQLISFYDHHPDCKPSFRFIGVSKKSCYLCHMFLLSHPDSFSVSSCHQKLYVSWIPPPAVQPNIYRRYKRMTTELSKVMELAARRDLDYRLGAPRKGGVADSTAGVSLSGLTEVSTMGMGVQAHLFSQEEAIVLRGSADEGPVAMEDEVAEEESPSTIGFMNPTPPIDEPRPIGFNQTPASTPTEQFPESSSPTTISAMVFHFVRAGDLTRQDIVGMSDILDPVTNFPSWANLVEVLKVDNDYGLAFREHHEYLMVNDRIRVRNERQFRACLQYLRNSNILNSEALVCGFDETP
ncbi:MAG: hypothetical protein M1840_006938 [Geoglossum simile]|nr:MAG: hypothetical protein M1840_006938 [Geoglossum simile]